MLSDFYNDIIVLTIAYCTLNICITLLAANKVSLANIIGDLFSIEVASGHITDSKVETTDRLFQK